MNKPSYNPKACCNSPCWAEDSPDPCYGDVSVIDELTYEDDYEWVHGCEGHPNYCGDYEPEKREERVGFSNRFGERDVRFQRSLKTRKKFDG